MHFLGKQQRLCSALLLSAAQIIMLAMKGGEQAASWVMALLKNTLPACFLWKPLLMELSEYHLCALVTQRRKHILSKCYQG